MSFQQVCPGHTVNPCVEELTQSKTSSSSNVFDFCTHSSIRGLLKPSFSRTPNTTATLTNVLSSGSFVQTGKTIYGVLTMRLSKEANNLTLVILSSSSLYDSVSLQNHFCQTAAASCSQGGKHLPGRRRPTRMASTWKRYASRIQLPEGR
jgi:hypothetical protein